MTATLDLEPGPVAVGILVGLSGLLFLLTPVVEPVAVGSLQVSTVALSAVVLTLGFALGTVVFAHRGQRLFAIAHGIFAVAWALLVLGPLLGQEALLLAGVVVLVAGAGFLVSQSRQ
ncbi:hypothetical protein BVU17_03150 [Haloarcula taiwanensis]|uniref:Uncharacterized protein n=1 Tax=Haloarcula taiwanensis TaxID=1932004 RepID=A0A2H4ZVP6_9EURY|nr:MULTISPECIES: hypothetical protein [Haloarcula]AUG46564.1 hypothetical protein BVU17_03150 [Haloarcula taiwanensis]RLM36764.1 hypothetical protein DVK01_09100 [Haloarcula sp. Atlit-120R]RLM44845.1 hypothetical protein DVK00_10350 [Haloarcula sp. Atlit-47R]RLN01734.1 hypothetical protein D3D01_02635 [Haloarcula sp. Atlit-7R]